MNKKRILILCSDNYHKQPRVLRTIEALDKEYIISVAGNSDAKQHVVNFIDLSKNKLKDKNITYWHFNKPSFIKYPVSFYYKYIKQKQFSKALFYENQYWTNSKKSDLKQLKEFQFDLIISHGIDTLPLAIKLAAKKIPVIFNAHEYYPLEFEQDKYWLKTEGESVNYIIKKYLPQISLMFCVSECIQKEYQKVVDVESEVITNATIYVDINVKETTFPIKIIHHGAAIRARQIEIMADVMDYLNENYCLYFMLVPTDKLYLDELKKRYRSNKRIKFIDTVPVNEIPKECNKYDIGLFILPPVNFNWLNALPNKFFEYVQGRLAIAVSPNPDMKSKVEEYNIGVVSDDYTARNMAGKIASLKINDIDNIKLNTHLNARRLSAEYNQKNILKLVNQQLLN